MNKHAIGYKENILRTYEDKGIIKVEDKKHSGWILIAMGISVIGYLILIAKLFPELAQIV